MNFKKLVDGVFKKAVKSSEPLIKKNNEIVMNVIQQRASHREFASNELSKDEIDRIIMAAKSAPTSMDGHSFSIIKVIDAERKKQVAKWCNQKYIANAGVLLLFVVDFTRTIELKSAIEESATEQHLSPLTSSLLNIGLSMMAAIIQGESMDIGATCIGALKAGSYNDQGENSFLELKELFKLPEGTFIACGVIMGKKTKVIPPKPKFPNRVDVFENVYQENTFTEQEREQHNQALKNYYVNVIKLPALAKKSWSEVQKGALVYKKGEESIILNREKALLDFLHLQNMLKSYIKQNN